MFDILARVRNDNAKGEYYITDAVRILAEDGKGVGAIAALPAEDATGINSPADLAVVARIMQNRVRSD
jgi:bifunctional UDP-N-acetylglucosamine pyrophosphorylase/glucosamine-1-phosphate N-acetyltransferase